MSKVTPPPAASCTACPPLLMAMPGGDTAAGAYAASTLVLTAVRPANATPAAPP